MGVSGGLGVTGSGFGNLRGALSKGSLETRRSKSGKYLKWPRQYSGYPVNDIVVRSRDDGFNRTFQTH